MKKTKDLALTRTQEELEALLEQPAPRVVPAEVFRSAVSPISAFIIFMGLFVLVMALWPGVLMAIEDSWRLSTWVVSGSNALVGLVMVTWGMLSRRRCKAILSHGRLCKGLVKAVKPLPARINSRTFFSVRVSIDDWNATEVSAKDTVDNWAMEFYLDARDQQEEVDVIYYPRVPNRAILPMKMAFTKRFD